MWKFLRWLGRALLWLLKFTLLVVAAVIAIAILIKFVPLAGVWSLPELPAWAWWALGISLTLNVVQWLWIGSLRGSLGWERTVVQITSSH